MKEIQFKTISDSVLDVDDKSRIVKVAISEVGIKDLDNDVVDPGAFTKTIKERGPVGSKMIWHLTDHNPSLKSAVGKPSEIYMDGTKLVFNTPIAKTDWGNDVLEMYKSDMINQHSQGFRAMDQGPVKGEDYNLIKEIKLYEGSAVLWGANPNTPTISVGKALTKEELETEVKKISDELTVLAKCLKSGSLMDETFELVELRIINLKDKIRSLFLTVTTPAAKAQGPVKEKEFAEQLKLLSLTI